MDSHEPEVVGLKSDLEDQHWNCRKPKQIIQNQALGFYQCREKKQKKQGERKDG